MDSSEPFVSSSSRSPRNGFTRGKSRFTFKHLSQLKESSTQCPLRVIAHVDLDGFYAQCEMVRLGVAEDQPLAVQQWQGLIAINYPARKFGVARFVTIPEAKRLCPQIILQHVATWKEGDEKWAYHPDAWAHIATHKVSLDPYRLESRKIFSLIKATLPPVPIQKVEKAGIDEVFLDLSAQIHSILLVRYPELQKLPPDGDLTEFLPAPPTTALNWNADALVDLGSDESEDDDPDWDDVAMLIGSEIVASMRRTIREQLKYTCSAGIARNKMLSKLGSAHNKPNAQTVVRNRAVQQFLSELKFTKIRNLGGKLGDEVVSMFNTDTVKDLLEFPLEQLKRLGDDTGIWLYKTIRGEDHSEVNSRTEIKSMLSAKSFRPSINTFESATKWLRIFVADIFSRLVEEGVLENKRRPKTINLHHRQGGKTKSKQAPIPSGKSIDENLLFDLSKNLMAQVIVDGRAWPCSNLSLSVGGFEDGPTGNQRIGGFLVHGEEGREMRSNSRGIGHIASDVDAHHPPKRRQASTADLQSFFRMHAETLDDHHRNQETEYENKDFEHMATSAQPCTAKIFPNDDMEAERKNQNTMHQKSLDMYFCRECNRSMHLDEKDEHQDWHFAKELQHQEQTEFSDIQRAVPKRNHPQKPAKSKPKPKPASGTSRAQNGQSRLAFER